MENTKHFKPKAHILRLLGEELIKSPIMAIYELVKNSYDADATFVNVTFENIEDIEQSIITIKDNGTGLTSDVIENVWLEPGTDHRKPINKDGIRVITRSPLFNRVPMGEKGVGRFAVHKLGNKITLITRPASIKKTEGNKIQKIVLDYEITLTIDWHSFSQSKYLEDIPISWKTETDKSKFHFQDESGTLIKISGLKESWSRRMARGLKRNIISMLSPKNNTHKFQINLDFQNSWLEKFPNAQEILDVAPYQFAGLLDENFNLTFDYSCSFQFNQKFGGREIKGQTENIRGKLIKSYKEELEKEENLSKKELSEHLRIFDSPLPFGNILFETYTYDLDSETLKNYTHDSKTLKKILKAHAGIKVFKDEMRVFDYGEPGNDWLELENRRINNKSWISNKLNIGYVFLDSENSSCLIEKTNREGFVESLNYKLFERCLIGIINEYRIERWKDRQKWLDLIKPSPNRNKFINQTSLFNELIDSTDFSEEEQKEKLKVEAKRLEKDFETKKEILLIPAGVGMTASVALHEIEKLVPRMKEVINTSPFAKEVANERVEELDDYLKGILSVLRKGSSKPIDTEECIRKAISNYSFKLKKREIKVITDFQTLEFIKCDKRYFITMLMNIIDNSIYWLDTIYKERKSIYIKTYLDNENISILCVDNGPGFKDDINDLVMPFFSRKDDGIGIGLYLIDTIMMKYGKLEILNEIELNKLNIDNNFRGAAIKLTFNKN